MNARLGVSDGAPTLPNPAMLDDLLAGLVDQTQPAQSPAWRTVAIQDLALDSRQVKPRDLFLALPGERSDGRRFIAQARRRGASAVVYEKRPTGPVCSMVDGVPQVGIVNLQQQVSAIAGRFFQHPSARLHVVGITGTNGKTTCACLLAQAYERLGVRSACVGTLGVSLGADWVGGGCPLPEAGELTTPDGIQVQRNLSALLQRQVETVCMEVSSHGLQQGRVNQVAFDTAVFTNLTQDHLDYHGDMAHYAQAKHKLFRVDGLRWAVINRRDAFAVTLLQQNTAENVLTYGRRNADLTAHRVCCDAAGIRFEAAYRGQRLAVESSLIGQVNLDNLLAVIGALLGSGFELHEAAAVLPQLRPPPGRMERFPTAPNRPTMVVDYAHTPDSLAWALRSLRPLTGGRLWCVYGCGGNRDRAKRAPMGQAANRWADEIIVTNDNPRLEDPEQIAGETLAGIARRASPQVRVILDRVAAVEYAFERAAADDVVLIAGRGHEQFQLRLEGRVPLSDRDTVTALLGGGG